MGSDKTKKPGTVARLQYSFVLFLELSERFLALAVTTPPPSVAHAQTAVNVPK